MEWTLSAIEKGINSLLMKSEYEISSVSWTVVEIGAGLQKSIDTLSESHGGGNATHAP